MLDKSVKLIKTEGADSSVVVALHTQKPFFTSAKNREPTPANSKRKPENAAWPDPHPVSWKDAHPFFDKKSRVHSPSTAVSLGRCKQNNRDNSKSVNSGVKTARIWNQRSPVLGRAGHFRQRLSFSPVCASPEKLSCHS